MKQQIYGLKKNCHHCLFFPLLLNIVTMKSQGIRPRLHMIKNLIISYCIGCSNLIVIGWLFDYVNIVLNFSEKVNNKKLYREFFLYRADHMRDQPLLSLSFLHQQDEFYIIQWRYSFLLKRQTSSYECDRNSSSYLTIYSRILSEEK